MCIRDRGKWFPTGSDVSQPLAIRRAVFGRGRDALDDWAQQVTVYAGEEPVGTDVYKRQA